MTLPSETNHSHEVNESGAHIIDSPHINIPGVGTVKGILDKNNKVAKFLNIPFGLIEERWRPAAKAKSWDGIRDATRLG